MSKPTLARLGVNNVTLGLSGEPSHMSRRTQCTHYGRNSARTLIRRRSWQTQPTDRLTVQAVKHRPPNKRSKTQANSPKLPITWTM